MAGGYYRTGDEARRDDAGYIHFVGRGDDVFKSSDYRISPFELESVLVEHELVAEAAVVPSPDPVRLSVPKAFVVLKPGHARDAGDGRARSSSSARAKLAPYKRVRRLEFARAAEDHLGQDSSRRAAQARGPRRGANERSRAEFWLDEMG